MPEAYGWCGAGAGGGGRRCGLLLAPLLLHRRGRAWHGHDNNRRQPGVRIYLRMMIKALLKEYGGWICSELMAIPACQKREAGKGPLSPESLPSSPGTTFGYKRQLGAVDTRKGSDLEEGGVGPPLHPPRGRALIPGGSDTTHAGGKHATLRLNFNHSCRGIAGCFLH